MESKDFEFEIATFLLSLGIGFVRPIDLHVPCTVGMDKVIGGGSFATPGRVID